MMTGRIESINTSSGGVPKTSVIEALVTARGIDGDRQSAGSAHGGRDRAVVLYSLEMIRALQREGHPIAPGTIGENLTISGIDWSRVTPGVKLAAGNVLLRVTQYAAPGDQIRSSFLGDNFSRVSHQHHPGWSRVCARVLSGGVLRIGDPISLRVGIPSRST